MKNPSLYALRMTPSYEKVFENLSWLLRSPICQSLVLHQVSKHFQDFDLLNPKSCLPHCSLRVNQWQDNHNLAQVRNG